MVLLLCAAPRFGRGGGQPGSRRTASSCGRMYTVAADVTSSDVKTTVCTGFPTKGDGERAGAESTKGLWEKFVETGEATNAYRGEGDGGRRAPSA